jgi:hypothetical protein
MVGKLHKSWPGGHVYVLVAVDKFTKWIKVVPVTSADATSVVNFIKGIVFRFDVPNSIVTHNDINFTSREFKDYCVGVASSYSSHRWRTRKPTVKSKKPMVLSAMASRSVY